MPPPARAHVAEPPGPSLCRPGTGRLCAHTHMQRGTRCGSEGIVDAPGPLVHCNPGVQLDPRWQQCLVLRPGKPRAPGFALRATCPLVKVCASCCYGLGYPKAYFRLVLCLSLSTRDSEVSAKLSPELTPSDSIHAHSRLRD